MKKLISKLIPHKLKEHYINIGKANAFKGNNVYCHCCEKSFITFLPFGVNLRANAMCPNCNSLERHRLIWYFLVNFTNIRTEKAKLLHIAPEKIFYEKFTNLKNIDYTCGDLFPQKYSYAKNIVKMDITNIPYQENLFDIVFCSHVLEHIPEDIKAMKEIYRIMKNGAWAILQVPIDYKRDITYEDFSINTDEGREKAFGLADHVRMYGRDYKLRLQNAGFKVEEIDLFKNLVVMQKV